MPSIKLCTALGAGLALAAFSFVASADGSASGMSRSSEPMYAGRSVHKKRARRSTGSYTNGKPDGANTGSRKQTPTGGNPGNGDHS